jgi:hypothetical protein
VRRLRSILIAVAVLAVAALAVWVARDRGDGAVRSALAAHIAGVEADDAGYTRLGPVLRARAWLLADLMSRLPLLQTFHLVGIRKLPAPVRFCTQAVLTARRYDGVAGPLPAQRSD